MSSVNVIVFGATGTVGAAAARAAKDRGAKVFLAVRDMDKSIPGLTLEQERAGGFERVKADLSAPETLRAAVATTNATRAFVYIAFGMPDGMKSAFEALKSAGIKFIVFLSSAGVRGDPRSAKPDDAISWVHAQAEISLEETFGGQGYVALRPGFFNTNALWWVEMIRADDMRLAYPEAKLDWIAPEDIGRVGGAVLVQGRPAALGGTDGKYNAIRLYGPQLLSQVEGASVLGRAVGKIFKVTGVGEEEYVSILSKDKPEILARNIVALLRARSGVDGDDGFYAEDIFGEASAHIEKYTGTLSTTFEQWLSENKGLLRG
ncbi:related to NmrA-like family protein [Cephalotrichum gorgonifer]|uniref:Related to NmrA-like family protein n=1 Tax=Cephalotrichum gorgonifer TaxID=2041049 RepID=A0AAE8SUN2_9PEZI|nr:related to NmrA-like family protein [Cephalotrichum gorgonifer]